MRAFCVIIVLLVSPSVLLYAQSFAIFQTASLAYNGISATRVGSISQATSQFDVTNKQMMARSTHIARSDVANVQLLDSNFYVQTDGGQELGSGAAATVTASIEYPAGVCTQIKFSGSSSGSVPNSGTLVSDSAAVSIPNGSTFWVRRYWTSTGGVIYGPVNGGGFTTITGDVTRVGVSGILDQTVSCDAITNNVSGFSMPLGIISTISKPSLCILGDSIAFGIGDSTSATGDKGMVARAIGPAFGYTNLAAPSDSAFAYTIRTHTGRAATYPYCSHKIIGYGANDLNGGRSLAQLETALTSVYASLGVGARAFQNTILPWDSNPAACSTPTGWETARVTFNDALKGGTYGPSKGMFDTAGAVETSTDSGAWKTTPQAWSGDCIHPSDFGAAQVATLGAIDTTRIVLP